MRLGLQGKQGLLRGILVLECQRRAGVFPDNICQHRAVSHDGFPEFEQLIGSQDAARQQQHRRAGQQNHQGELSFEGKILQPVHLPSPAVWTIFPRLNNCELTFNPSLLVAPALISNRTLVPARKKLMPPPRCANPSTSLTVSTGLESRSLKISVICPFSDLLTKIISQFFKSSMRRERSTMIL